MEGGVVVSLRSCDEMMKEEERKTDLKKNHGTQDVEVYRQMRKKKWMLEREKKGKRTHWVRCNLRYQ